jgi:hypothetical protein
VRQVQVEHPAAICAMKMPVLVHVRTEPYRSPLHLNLTRDPGLNQRIQAVVNRRHGDVGHRLLGAEKDFLRRRMVAFFLEHVIDALTLLGETKTGGRQLFAQLAGGWV